MKKLFLLIAIAALFTIDLSAQTQYKIVTVVESIVPAGLGRSRIIEETNGADAGAATTSRTEGTDSNMDNVRRRDLKVDNFEETKLLNFFSLGGINFQNIASNDALITDKLNTLTAEGWELAFVTSGVESSAGGDDGEGIFITRFVFKK
ncbi:hypothetical protein [Lewinella sp. LCG006]|uniref:hypothetical protein n=1 Tax=Lewinella sp. LCG006 TaxID=3231911 RepID=UPI00345F2B85